MAEWFDMGGYEFYVWGSMLCFFVVMAADLLSLRSKKKQALRLVKSRFKRTKK